MTTLLINTLAQHPSCMRPTATGGVPVYVPDERGVLARAGELAFNDAPWLATQPTAGSVGAIKPGGNGASRLVHPKLSNQVAEAVGAASLRRLLIFQSSGVEHDTLHGLEFQRHHVHRGTMCTEAPCTWS